MASYKVSDKIHSPAVYTGVPELHKANYSPEKCTATTTLPCHGK